jgi:hypothetical protein
MDQDASSQARECQSWITCSTIAGWCTDVGSCLVLALCDAVNLTLLPSLFLSLPLSLSLFFFWSASHEVNLTLHPDAEKSLLSSVKLVRYQINPQAAWGPARAAVKGVQKGGGGGGGGGAGGKKKDQAPAQQQQQQ